jgi:hypothetical protein
MSEWPSQSGPTRVVMLERFTSEESNLSGHVRVIYVRVVHVTVDPCQSGRAGVDKPEWSNPRVMSEWSMSVVHVRGPCQSGPCQSGQAKVDKSEWSMPEWPSQGGPCQSGRVRVVYVRVVLSEWSCYSGPVRAVLSQWSC